MLWFGANNSGPKFAQKLQKGLKNAKIIDFGTFCKFLQKSGNLTKLKKYFCLSEAHNCQNFTIFAGTTLTVQVYI